MGNCWLIAAISALAEVPGRIDSIFVNDEISENGIYAINMWALGVPITVYIDDYLPMNQGDFFYASLDSDYAIWPAILEKAMAKRYGSYDVLDGGWAASGVSQLNGSPWKHLEHSEIDDIDYLWEQLVEADRRNDIITAGTAGS